MAHLKQEWNVEMAMAVLGNKTVAADLWAEAVEWLMLYGPPQIKELLGQASSMATGKEFPELCPTGYNKDGDPLYDMEKLAESLGISATEATERLQQKEQEQDVQHLFSGAEAMKVQ